ncbi:MAG: T9SS type A sorting domain-containing protein [Cyclobacteriaceae bacterium]
MKKIVGFAFTLLVVFTLSVSAQDIIDVNIDVEHSVGGVSKLDRSKYMMLHAGMGSGEWPSEAYAEQFLEGYDTYLGRNNGSLPWNWSICEEDPMRPGWPDVSYLEEEGAKIRSNYNSKTLATKYEHRISRYMMGGQEGMYPTTGHIINPRKQGLDDWAIEEGNYESLGEFYANFFKYFFSTGDEEGEPFPKYIEVMNEPFVKSGKLGTTNANMTEMHKVVARRIRELNPQALVGGYSAAHPAYEASDFKHWQNNWKLFIDEAGADMDFFSLHLYDNVQKIPEEGQYRAGSNVEAILDMVEHYGYLKLGEVKPFCLSEYGCLNTEGEPYTRERDWNNIRSFSTMMMQFLERPNVIDQALPFIILQAKWWKHPTDPNIKYAHRLFRQKKELEGETGDEWVFTEVVKFYQLWSEVNGTRVDTKSTNIDTQVDAYVEGNKVYLAINNLHHEPRTVNINMDGFGDAQLQSIFIKHLHAENDGVPALDETTQTDNIDVFNIGREATAILEYTFDKPIAISNSSSETKYFADTYLKPIKTDQQIIFKINEVSLDQNGEAVLRLGVGRDHGKSLRPKLTINGTEVKVPANWRGNDQKGRDRFFGVLEIPIPYSLLKVDNEISVTFSDDGGHVSSVTMQVFNFSREITRTEEEVTLGAETEVKESNELLVFPNPVNDFVTIQSGHNAQVFYSIISISGAKILSGSFTQKKVKLNLQGLNKGIYLLDLLDQNGDRQTFRITKR